MDTVSKMVDLISELRDIAEEKGAFLSIDVDYCGSMKVQVNLANSFFNLFDTFDVLESNGEYPYKVVADIEGIQFTTLLTATEHAKYVKKQEA